MFDYSLYENLNTPLDPSKATEPSHDTENLLRDINYCRGKSIPRDWNWKVERLEVRVSLQFPGKEMFHLQQVWEVFLHAGGKKHALWESLKPAGQNDTNSFCVFWSSPKHDLEIRFRSIIQYNLRYWRE